MGGGGRLLFFFLGCARAVALKKTKDVVYIKADRRFYLFSSALHVFLQ